MVVPNGTVTIVGNATLIGRVTVETLAVGSNGTLSEH
jgi:hypothetical protein